MDELPVNPYPLSKEVHEALDEIKGKDARPTADLLKAMLTRPV